MGVLWEAWNVQDLAQAIHFTFFFFLITKGSEDWLKQLIYSLDQSWCVRNKYLRTSKEKICL